MGEKSFLPTSTPRWHHAEGTFFGGLPCIGIIEIPIHEQGSLRLQIARSYDRVAAETSPEPQPIPVQFPAA
ncbi:hypothetical protein DND36_30670 [Pseudomonas savastanoi pv. glycinea]|nr:hypothetical protein DND36_30670 [Pseudomonas savastanoi pv. glycinea]